MSDQTPEAAIEASEPSMEDILASIRKIIADDDAPESAAFDNRDLTTETDSIGNISDLVAVDDTASHNETFRNEDKTIDPGVEHFVQDDVSARGSDLDTTLDDSVAADGIMNDLMMEMPSAVPDDGEAVIDLELDTISEVSNDTDLAASTMLSSTAPNPVSLPAVETALAKDDEFVDLVNYDLETEFSETVDLEIPTPQPNEALSKQSDVQELITPFAAISPLADEGGLGLGLDETGAITSIDDELSALLDTSLTLEDENTAADSQSQDAQGLAQSEEGGLTDLDLTDDTSLDLDLAAMLDGDNLQNDVAEDGAIEDILEDADGFDANLADIDLLDDAPQADIVSLDNDFDLNLDDELESLDEDIQLVSPEADLTQADETFALEAIDPEDAALTEFTTDALTSNAFTSDEAGLAGALSEDVPSEEDADLLLVKSLMADLADYNTDGEDAQAEFEQNSAAEMPNDEDLDMSSDLDDMDALSQIDDEILELETETDISSDESLSEIADITDADETDILDEILEMTLEDELLSETDLDITTLDDVAELELENIAENADLDGLNIDVTHFDEAGLNISNPAPTGLSLSDIAAAADADANAIGDTAAMGAGLAGVGAAVLGASGAAIAAGRDTLEEDNVEQRLSKLLDGADTDIPEDETFDLENFAINDEMDGKTDDISEILTIPSSEQATTVPESLNELEAKEEITDMPRAAARNTDVIMDDVTETATASVFAELNQVVEEKAIVAERGDRVGDLVMEALRPMLKEWLDTNLKGIVERAVTKEVKRISSGK